MVRVKVLREFPYQGRTLTADTVLDMPVHQAALAKRRGLVIQTTAALPEVEPAEQIETSPPQKRRYRRRDLVADAS